MAYRLGVDLGTTYTAAAVAVDGAAPVVLELGLRAAQVPSVLYVAGDGTVLVGEAAERRGSADPARLVREFKRRLGDHVPILVGGAAYSPESLAAQLLRWVVDQATARQGEPPTEVVLTHPATWGGYRLEVLDQLVALADLERVRHCTEPEAAAAQYAAHRPLAVGDRLAVYDLGGGTFDTCVLERTADGFALLGRPEGLDHLGGVDFDEVVFAHVVGALADRLAGLDPDYPAVDAALARLRRDCVEAKESLSADVDAVVPVALPTGSTSVRLTRAEFEAMIRPALTETVTALRRTLRSAQVEPAQLRAVVLVGGSSRIPLVGELLQRELGVPTAVDTHPKHDVALGALRVGTPLPAVAPPPHGSSVLAAAAEGVGVGETDPTPAPAVLRRHPRPAALAVAVAVLAAVVLGLGVRALVTGPTGSTAGAAPTPAGSVSSAGTPEPAARVSLDGGEFTWPGGVTLRTSVARSETWTLDQQYCADRSCGSARTGDRRVVLAYEVSVPRSSPAFPVPAGCPGELVPADPEARKPAPVPEFYARTLGRTVKPGATASGAVEYTVAKAAAGETLEIRSSCGDTTGTGAYAVFSGRLPAARPVQRPGQVGDRAVRGRYLDRRVVETRSLTDSTFAALVETCVRRTLPPAFRTDEALGTTWTLATSGGDVSAVAPGDSLRPAFPFGRYRKGSCVTGWASFPVVRGATVSYLAHSNRLEQWRSWRIGGTVVRAPSAPPRTSATPRRTPAPPSTPRTSRPPVDPEVESHGGLRTAEPPTPEPGPQTPVTPGPPATPG